MFVYLMKSVFYLLPNHICVYIKRVQFDTCLITVLHECGFDFHALLTILHAFYTA